ncbi:MAG: Fe-only nitrogenase accessory protein AnfO [Bacillota bacterium]|jgi:Fe-only nitrogenase accessory protein AnfO
MEEMNIAVMVDSGEQAISFDETGFVKLYGNRSGMWKVTKEMVFGINDLLSIAEIRERIRKMVKALAGCRIFVAAEVTGVPYAILEGMGFNIWKIQGAPAKFLDYIAANEARQKSVALRPAEKPAPVETERKGCYFIDLKTLLEKDSTLTSKQVLLPFLQNVDFKELEVICGHVPLWFAKEFPRLKLNTTTEQLAADWCKVVVFHSPPGD